MNSLRNVVADYCAITGVSAGTSRLHEIVLHNFETWLGRDATLDDLNDLTVAKYIAYRLTVREHETVRGEASKILAVWRWASGGKRRWIDPPEVTAPAPSYRLPRALDREQLARLWTAAQAYPRLVGSLPGNVVLTALLYVLWDSGERIGACYQINRDDCDLKAGWISVPPEHRKGGRQGRIYPVRSVTCKWLERLMCCYDGPMIFGECSLNNLYKHWCWLRAEAGLPKWATWHTIRKSHASHIIPAGGDACLSLGHGSPVITVRHYIDPRIASDGQRPCDLLFDPAQPAAAKHHWWQRGRHG